MAAPSNAVLDSVSVTATDVPAVAGDRIDGLKDASLQETGDFVETNYLGGSQYKSRVQTLKDTAGDLSGDFQQGDPVQAILRAARDSGVTVFVSWVFDSAASAGSKGKRIPMKVQEYSEKLAPGNLVEFTCKLLGNGAPTAI